MTGVSLQVGESTCVLEYNFHCVGMVWYVVLAFALFVSSSKHLRAFKASYDTGTTSAMLPRRAPDGTLKGLSAGPYACVQALLVSFHNDVCLQCTQTILREYRGLKNKRSKLKMSLRSIILLYNILLILTAYHSFVHFSCIIV